MSCDIEMDGIYVGDEGTALDFGIRDETGAAVDLTAAAAIARFRRPGSGETFDRDLVIGLDAEDGKASYTVEEGDFGVAGMWRVQVQVTTDLGSWWARPATFYVAAELPGPA